MGWSATSQMSSVYLHYELDVVNDKIKLNKGIKNEELENKKRPQEFLLTPVNCPKCNEINSKTNVFCSKCNCSLDSNFREKYS